MSAQRGATTALVAGLMILIIGVAALAVDIGVLAFQKRSLQSAVDLAALAGAQELPDDPAHATAVARDYLGRNRVVPAEVTGVTVAANRLELTVTAQRTVPLYLARVLGHQFGTVTARARARLDMVGGVVPWGQESRPLQYGQEYTLKFGAGHFPQPLMGNFLILDYSGNMNIPQYEQWTAHGYNGAIYVGQSIETHPGHLGVSTKQAVLSRIARAQGYNCSPADLAQVDPACPLVVTVPVVKTFVDLNGFGHVVVKRFARVLITRMDPGPSANLTIYGVFLDPDLHPAGRVVRQVALVE